MANLKNGILGGFSGKVGPIGASHLTRKPKTQDLRQTGGKLENNVLPTFRWADEKNDATAAIQKWLV